MLHDPLTLRCGLVLPDRTALAPLTNLQSHADGTLSDAEQAWLVRRAGFGLVSTCAAYVHPLAKAWRGQLGIADDTHLPGLERLAAALRDAGTKAIVQLHHAGEHATVAPERISADDGERARAATAAELAEVVDAYAEAAARAERAGFDGVEIHGANGYLFTQFLAPDSNTRTDAWGGPLAHRAKLLRDTLQAVRAEVDPGFAVGVRISPVDQVSRRGLVLDDSLQVGRWLAEDGADFVHLSLRDAAAPAPFEPERGPVVSAFAEVLPDEVALVAAGGMWTAEDARAVLALGADIVVAGTGGDRQPGLDPARAESGMGAGSAAVDEASARRRRRQPALLPIPEALPGPGGRRQAAAGVASGTGVPMQTEIRALVAQHGAPEALADELVALLHSTAVTLRLTGVIESFDPGRPGEPRSTTCTWTESRPSNRRTPPTATRTWD